MRYLFSTMRIMSSINASPATLATACFVHRRFFLTGTREDVG